MNEPYLEPEAPDVNAIVARVYRDEIVTVADRALWGLSTLVEVEKDLLSPVCEAIARSVRDRSPGRRTTARLVGAKLNAEDPTYAAMLKEFETQVAQSADKIFLLPHLDLMTAADSGLTGVTKLFLQVLSSYPDTVVVGFFDPGFTCHKSLQDYFPSRVRFSGITRDNLRSDLLAEDEKGFLEAAGVTPLTLFKYTSGLNAVKFRKIMEAVRRNKARILAASGPREAVIDQVRHFTVTEGFEIPDIRLDRDIGGYAAVKTQLKENILSVLETLEGIEDPARIRQMEQLIPRGIIFHGPPGTGKTLFAKALASEIHASIQVISGPEIKSRWFGESEERIRKIFFQARKNAPAVVVFDELDAVAPTRGMYQGGAGVEHSIVNQLLTELDGFRSDNLVIFVGTTNFLESIDPALLRPGRVELKVCIDYPDEAARREILAIYDRKYEMGLPPALKDYLVEKTGDWIDRERGTRFSGDHLCAVARFLKREQVKTGRPSDRETADRALGLSTRRIALSPAEERVVAVHEAGHALAIARLIPDREVRKVSILAETEDSLGITESALKENRYQFNREDMDNYLVTLLGGRAAERVLLGDLSMGAAADIQRATQVARAMVEVYGFSDLGPMSFEGKAELSEAWKVKVDETVNGMIQSASRRAEELVTAGRETILRLREMLLERKTLGADDIREVLHGQG
ncbi:MAG: AAA family ATPase [Acidobacteria bacterium]|nr:AAA family ATPase [Acidobacteriota bacterium]